MNIFILDEDPSGSARMLGDRHVVKMILESAQMLCLAHSLCGDPNLLPENWRNQAWKNHPCSKWVRASLQNYIWLANHAVELCNEYTYRYGKIHKLSVLVSWLLANSPLLENKGLLPFAAATGEIHEADSVSTYRRYYFEHKTHLMVWTKREPPTWIIEKLPMIKIGDKWKLSGENDA